MADITSASGAKRSLTYIAETVPGAAPTAGVHKTLRNKFGVKMDLSRDTFMSKERRSDRQESAMTYGNKSGSLSIPVEWSYGTYDDILEAILGGTWTTNVLKIGNTARTFMFEDGAPDVGMVEQVLGAQFSGFSISQKTNGIAEGSIDGIFRNISGPQTKGVNLAYDATAKTITRATAGFTTIDGWEVGDYVCGLGNTDAGNNNATPWVITSLTDTVMTFTTMTGAVTKTSTAGITLNNASRATSVTAASTQAAFDSFSGTISEGGSTVGYVTGWDLKVEQALTPNFACGSDSPVSTTLGTVKVSGSISVYYVDQSLRKKFLNGTATSLVLTLGATSKKYDFTMGTAKYTSNTRDDAEGVVTETLNYAATYDSGNASTLMITRTP